MVCFLLLSAGQTATQIADFMLLVLQHLQAMLGHQNGRYTKSPNQLTII